MASEIFKKKRRLKTFVKKFNSFEEAEKAEVEYWQNLTPKAKLRILDEIQLMQLKALYPRGKKFEKVVRIVKLGED
jgi:hypothetical protein